jgi:hypothetical protein
MANTLDLFIFSIYIFEAMKPLLVFSIWLESSQWIGVQLGDYLMFILAMQKLLNF